MKTRRIIMKTKVFLISVLVLILAACQAEQPTVAPAPTETPPEPLKIHVVVQNDFPGSVMNLYCGLDEDYGDAYHECDLEEAAILWVSEYHGTATWFNNQAAFLYTPSEVFAALGHLTMGDELIFVAREDAGSWWWHNSHEYNDYIQGDITYWNYNPDVDSEGHIELTGSVFTNGGMTLRNREYVLFTQFECGAQEYTTIQAAVDNCTP
ncbi:hypothetical protein ACFL1M_03830 [Patescibacteria group bacterium]